MQRRDGDDRRAHREVGGLVARDLDHPALGIGRRGRVPGRGAQVAADDGAAPEPGEEVAQDRGRRALALGARDGHHPVELAPGGSVVEPQPEAAGDRHAGDLQRDDVGAVAGDARGLHHHVALDELVDAAVLGGEHRPAVDLVGGRRVVDEHHLGAGLGGPGDAGPPLDPHAPDADLQPAEVVPPEGGAGGGGHGRDPRQAHRRTPVASAVVPEPTAVTWERPEQRDRRADAEAFRAAHPELVVADPVWEAHGQRRHVDVDGDARRRARRSPRGSISTLPAALLVGAPAVEVGRALAAVDALSYWKAAASPRLRFAFALPGTVAWWERFAVGGMAEFLWANGLDPDWLPDAGGRRDDAPASGRRRRPRHRAPAAFRRQGLDRQRVAAGDGRAGGAPGHLPGQRRGPRRGRRQRAPGRLGGPAGDDQPGARRPAARPQRRRLPQRPHALLGVARRRRHRRRRARAGPAGWPPATAPATTRTTSSAPGEAPPGR